MLPTFGNISNSRCLWLVVMLCVVLPNLQATSAAKARMKFEGDSCTMNSTQGVCTLISQCNGLEEAIKNKRFTLFELVHCGFGVYEEIICCPTATATNAVPVIETKIDDRPHLMDTPLSTRFDQIERPAVRACKVIEEGLSPSLHDHIIGGAPVAPGDYPHMVALGYERIGYNPDWDFRCGGTLISARHVLTAAHCVVGGRGNQPVIARLGVTNFTDKIQMRDVVDIPIKAIHAHSNFSDILKIHDIAVLELAEEVNFTQNVYPTCLYTELGDPALDLRLTVTGWGQTTIERGTFSTILLYGNLTLEPLPRCIEAFRKEKFELSRGHLCATDPGLKQDACQGDSGGPLNLIIDQSTRKYRLVGVVAAGFSCASVIPGLYTRVAAYLDFIEEIVWANLN